MREAEKTFREKDGPTKGRRGVGKIVTRRAHMRGQERGTSDKEARAREEECRVVNRKKSYK